MKVESMSVDKCKDCKFLSPILPSGKGWCTEYMRYLTSIHGCSPKLR